jgi:hypothetical protein
MLLLLLIPFALALVVLSVLGLAGIGPLTDERRADRGGLSGSVGPAIGLLVGGGLLVLTVAGSLLLVGLGSNGGGEGDRGDAPDAASPPTTSVTRTEPTRRATHAAALGPEVTVEAQAGETFPASYDVADRLVTETVLQMYGFGFEPFTRAVAEQCVPNGFPRCGNPIPVQFDADGEARFQYLVSDEFLDLRPVPGGCKANTAPCTIVVRAVDGNTHGAIQTIFGDALPPPGRIEVTPSSGLSLDGERVTVEVHDYPPGVTVTAMLCAAPDATGPRCGKPGPTAPLVVGRDGTGSTALVIEPGRVGEQSVPCSRGDDCGVSVASDDVFARAPVVQISFAAPPGAGYDPTRLALGLGLAVLLVAMATWLILRTDWSAVGEAAAPEIDDADYADLDAIIAALPPEEDELVSS